jgi:hypothetical protein
MQPASSSSRHKLFSKANATSTATALPILGSHDTVTSQASAGYKLSHFLPPKSPIRLQSFPYVPTTEEVYAI